MVNNQNVSAYHGTPPDQSADRKISGGPLYKTEEVSALLTRKGIDAFTAWTRKCTNDLQGYGLDPDDVLELLCLAIKSGYFLGSEWCMQKPGGPWAACDAYRLHKREYIAYLRKEMTIEYYIKYAIGKTGQILLLVSCHLYQNRS